MDEITTRLKGLYLLRQIDYKLLWKNITKMWITAGRCHFHFMLSFYTPWRQQKTFVFRCFQGVWNSNIGQKWVNEKAECFPFGSRKAKRNAIEKNEYQVTVQLIKYSTVLNYGGGSFFSSWNTLLWLIVW